jgi:hypothetical protein
VTRAEHEQSKDRHKWIDGRVAGRIARVELPQYQAALERAVELLRQHNTSYAQHLELRRKVGDIVWWAFEPIRVRVAKNTYFVPDFMVMLSSGELELHDTKGSKRVTRKSGLVEEVAYTKEDAQMKMKIVAELLPIPLKKVWRTHSGEWESRLMP